MALIFSLQQLIRKGPESEPSAYSVNGVGSEQLHEANSGRLILIGDSIIFTHFGGEKKGTYLGPLQANGHEGPHLFLIVYTEDGKRVHKVEAFGEFTEWSVVKKCPRTTWAGRRYVHILMGLRDSYRQSA